MGFDSAQLFGFDDIKKTEFYSENAAILDQPRGAGYWLWKPFIIRKALERAKSGDVIFYCDAGRSPYYQFTRRPVRLEASARASEQGFLLGAAIPHLGSVGRWTKRDCLILMGSDTIEMRSNHTIMATWSLWTPSDAAFSFLDEWLKYCQDPRCLTDGPSDIGFMEHPEYSAHKHDQSIMSVLAHKRGAKYLDFSRTNVQRLMNWRPNSLVAHQFYKRPENAESLLAGDHVLMLVREHLRLRRLFSDSIK
ncbi:hypothetical protein X759_28840 [Mesorhizobium sp. LSHC420B00]|uniref:hypothetical protein n=1 Tax=Mesorhizobium sp. LSHC420B00 TaxID=1287292 RepID=UPI0003CF66FE|nr:hypothetical protein [Mesorhizobium sp. LSHC420B00]ESX65434.1 hypothetical protein X759_28840 [Mesorhizobium sp. LSHC420B00]